MKPSLLRIPRTVGRSKKMDSQTRKTDRDRQTERLRHRLAAYLSCLVVSTAAAAAAFALVLGASPAQATHNNVACDDDVPAGWSCVPFVNKPQSGPGITSPAFGEL